MQAAPVSAWSHDQQRGHRAAGTFALLSILAAWSGAAADTANFGDLDGNWSGSGIVSFADGSSERLRCTAQYTVGTGGDSLQQSIRCAAGSTQFHVNTYIKVHDAALSGSWAETTNDLSGRLSGNLGAGEIDVKIVYVGNVAATMSIALDGARQQITVKTSALNLSQISLTLART